jgi:hypothetical protein
MSSILNDIKKMLGISETYTAFDTDIIIIINSVFSQLWQMGVGPVNSYIIFNSNNVWSEYIDDQIALGLIKPYVYLKTRLLFDPPSNTTLTQAIQSNITELEWRIISFWDKTLEENNE